MEYLQIFPETLEALDELDDAQLGRMIRAMTVYATTGQEPDFEKGTPERMLWKAMKQRVDAAIRMSEKQAANRKTKPNQNNQTEPEKPEQTKPNQKNQTEPEQTKPNPEPEPEPESESDAEPEADQERENARARAREVRFTRFWTAYPRHTSSTSARKAFARLDPDDHLLEVMLDAIRRQRASPQWQDGTRFIPHPATWLNQKRWEDDIVTERPRPSPRPVAAQDYQQRDYTGYRAPLPDAMIAGMKELEHVDV